MEGQSTLVLSRKKGEKIVIPALGVEVTVVKTGTTVRIGVTAPENCTVLRAELQPHDTPAQAAAYLEPLRQPECTEVVDAA